MENSTVVNLQQPPPIGQRASTHTHAHKHTHIDPHTQRASDK